MLRESKYRGSVFHYYLPTFIVSFVVNFVERATEFRDKDHDKARDKETLTGKKASSREQKKATKLTTKDSVSSPCLPVRPSRRSAAKTDPSLPLRFFGCPFESLRALSEVAGRLRCARVFRE